MAQMAGSTSCRAGGLHIIFLMRLPFLVQKKCYRLPLRQSKETSHTIGKNTNLILSIIIREEICLNLCISENTAFLPTQDDCADVRAFWLLQLYIALCKYKPLQEPHRWSPLSRTNYSDSGCRATMHFAHNKVSFANHAVTFFPCLIFTIRTEFNLLSTLRVAIRI